MTVYLLERPEHYDVIVMENMFGDIMSDLAAATVGSMGMSPSSELGEKHGFFQAAHGSAPTIAGQNIANPYGTILSAASMLQWLGERHGDQRLIAAADQIERSVEAAMTAPNGLTRDLGGKATHERRDAARRRRALRRRAGRRAMNDRNPLGRPCSRRDSGAKTRGRAPQRRRAADMSISLDAPNPHFAVRPDWLALHDEPVLEPDLAIVDAHHHLWDRPESRYLFFDFLDDCGSGHNIRATVFMECGAMYRKDGAAGAALRRRDGIRQRRRRDERQRRLWRLQGLRRHRRLRRPAASAIDVSRRSWNAHMRSGRPAARRPADLGLASGSGRTRRRWRTRRPACSWSRLRPRCLLPSSASACRSTPTCITRSLLELVDLARGFPTFRSS